MELLTVPSASAEITLPKADKDLLIFFASSSTEPSAPVLLTCQEEKKRKEQEVLVKLHWELKTGKVS